MGIEILENVIGKEELRWETFLGEFRGDWILWIVYGFCYKYYEKYCSLVMLYVFFAFCAQFGMFHFHVYYIRIKIRGLVISLDM